MARHRHRKSHRSSHRSFKRGSNSTSNKYMPKVKTGLENVGSKVVDTTQKSVPYLQNMTRKFFGMFFGKTKTRKQRKH